MNTPRCIAYNKNNNKKCRVKLKENTFFCCKSHYPINDDIFELGCFMCTEKIKSVDELHYFRCRHVFHKECYNEWLKHSNYSESICMICRSEVLKGPLMKVKNRELGVLNKNDYVRLENIIIILNS